MGEKDHPRTQDAAVGSSHLRTDLLGGQRNFGAANRPINQGPNITAKVLLGHLAQSELSLSNPAALLNVDGHDRKGLTIGAAGGQAHIELMVNQGHTTR